MRPCSVHKCKLTLFEECHSVCCGFHYLAVVIDIFSQRGLGLTFISLDLGFLHNTFDNLPQTIQAGFEHKVGRPLFYTFNGQLFTQFSTDNDKRGVELFLFQNFKRPQGIELHQCVFGNNEVVFAIKLSKVLPFDSHTFDVWFKPGSL